MAHHILEGIAVTSFHQASDSEKGPFDSARDQKLASYLNREDEAHLARPSGLSGLTKELHQ